MMGVVVMKILPILLLIWLAPIVCAEETLPQESATLPDQPSLETSDVGAELSAPVPDSAAPDPEQTEAAALTPPVQEPPVPETILPPRNVRAEDFQGDNGTTLVVKWEPSETAGVTGYELYMKNLGDPQAEPEKIIRVRSTIFEYRDTDMEQVRIVSGAQHQYLVRTVKGEVLSEAAESNIAIPDSEWFKPEPFMIQVAIWTVVICAAFIYFIYKGKAGKVFYIRPIAGIQNVDEAIGRATEMGRPIMYVLGIGYIEYLSTIAALTILGRVAKKAAEYDTPILVPCCDYIVFPIAQEIVKTSYSDAGRPEAFKPENVYFVTTAQFAYVSNVCGTMQRDRPATNFFMGYFKAESLILAEAGASTGAIQIAGTDCDDQLPFFITACDYTLIGEELYAASAYLAREPILLGTLKAQDFCKALILIILMIGAVFMIFNQTFILDWFPTE